MSATALDALTTAIDGLQRQKGDLASHLVDVEGRQLPLLATH
jgi:hypothetical protein